MTQIVCLLLRIIIEKGKKDTQDKEKACLLKIIGHEAVLYAAEKDHVLSSEL